MSLAAAASPDTTRPRAVLPARDMAAQKRAFQTLTRERKAAGISLNKLLAEADVRPQTFYDGAKGASVTRPATLEALWKALERLRQKQPQSPPSAILALLHATERLLEQRLANCGVRLRPLALYLLTVEVEIQNADVARALKFNRQYVTKVRTETEDLREKDSDVDDALDNIGRMLRGDT